MMHPCYDINLVPAPNVKEKKEKFYLGDKRLLIVRRKNGEPFLVGNDVGLVEKRLFELLLRQYFSNYILNHRKYSIAKIRVYYPGGYSNICSVNELVIDEKEIELAVELKT